MRQMETLLSLRRRSMSQPLTVDPDLPPSAPATSSPSPSSSDLYSSSNNPIITNPPSSSSSSSSSRPKLSLTINTSHLHAHPTGGPISPTAPSPAETGTLVRRKSSVSNQRLPSEHPLPPTPPLPLNLTSPVSVSHFSSESSDSESLLDNSDRVSSSPISSPSSSSSYQPNIIRSTSISSSPSDQPNQPTPTQDLFWLPASLHPELAPQEFKAFIREQTSPEALARRTSINSPLGRANSKLGPNGRSNTGVGRRSSMLRGEYKPRANDGVSLEDVPGSGGAIQRNTSLKRSGSQSSTTGGGGGLAFEELTIKDLQRLEELAQRAEREQELKEGEGEGERLGRVLRRSLSLNPHRMAEAGKRNLHLSRSSRLSQANPSSIARSRSSGSSIPRFFEGSTKSPLIFAPGILRFDSALSRSVFVFFHDSIDSRRFYGRRLRFSFNCSSSWADSSPKRENENSQNRSGR